MLKILSPLIFIPMLLTACGDDHSDSAKETPPRVNAIASLIQITEENSQPKSLKMETTSTDDTQPIYRYTQLIDLNNDGVSQSYQLTYNFKTDHDYSLIVYFDASKNKPSKMQLWIDTTTPELSDVFSCGDEQEPSCDNISLEIDHKTGNSKVIFNQAKIYNYDKNTLNLSGSILGQLQQNPTIVKIPTSGLYNATYRISDQNQDIPMTHPNFKFFSFTNHNIQGFVTSESIHENLLYIITINDNVKEVWYTPSISIHPLSIWNSESKTNLQNISYNPINLTVNFNQFKMSNEGDPDLYINGTVGP